MTIGPTQIRKDLRLNIAYDEGKRANAPLGKIGNLRYTTTGSPKARMPGLFERFAIFWKAILQARKIERGSTEAQDKNFQADQRRVQKYTGELLGKLQAGFVQVRTESGHDKVLSSIIKTVGKLQNTIRKYSDNEGRKESIKKDFYNAVATIKNQRSDASVVRAGLEYLILERKSAMRSLPADERKVLHEIALAVDVRDEYMREVLYFNRSDKGYCYYKHNNKDSNFEPLDASLQGIMSENVAKNDQDEGTLITTGPHDYEQSESPPLLKRSNSESPREFSQSTATNNDQSQAAKN